MFSYLGRTTWSHCNQENFSTLQKTKHKKLIKLMKIGQKVIRKQHFLWVWEHLKVISEGSIVEYLPIRFKEDTLTILGKIKDIRPKILNHTLSPLCAVP